MTVEWSVACSTRDARIRKNFDRHQGLLFAAAVHRPDEEPAGLHKNPRQRIEFRTAGAKDGTAWQYEYRYYLSSATTNKFFHLMQLLTRRGSGGPVIALRTVRWEVTIDDNVRGRPKAGMTRHSMKVTSGPKGSVKYAVKDSKTGKTLLTYSATG
ncbi:hypothetical protein B0H17DRAFT_1198472 [Mycena rosella]|uniref:Uncharacterized protein n=1 Tax=Mycena rosella TaxID=1033263 RepID=A0AAD7GN63_MYCRO|nr:hypothetical protein B0H17DRAFT_1198472 [Mycena rosella]